MNDHHISPTIKKAVEVAVQEQSETKHYKYNLPVDRDMRDAPEKTPKICNTTPLDIQPFENMQTPTEVFMESDAVKDAISNAEEHVVYGNYYMTDIDKYLEEIETLSYIECAALRKSVASDLANLEQCKEMLGALAQMQVAEKTGDDLNVRLAQSNYLSDHYFHDANLDQFNQEYDHNHRSLTVLLEKLDEKMNRSNCGNSSKALNDEMVTLLEKRIRLLDTENRNYEIIKRRMENSLHPFQRRLDLDPLAQRFYTIFSNKGTVRELKRMAKRGGRDLEKGLRKIFSSRQIDAFIQVVREEIFTDNQKNRDGITIGDYFIATINHIAKADRRDGTNGWVKVMILNCAEIKSGIFDFCPSEEYFRSVEEKFYPIIETAM